MSIEVLVVVAVAVVFAAIVVSRQVRAWRKYSGKSVVTCPENRQPAGVSVDAKHAGVTSLLGSPELRLSSCSRWPERAGCGQPCLSQIAAAPEDCLVRSIVGRWYEGKSCVYCGKAFGPIEWTAARPALLPAGGVSLEWSEVPAEKLKETLETAQPVCSACHLAAKMVRERPEVVSDRSAKPAHS